MDNEFLFLFTMECKKFEIQSNLQDVIRVAGPSFYCTAQRITKRIPKHRNKYYYLKRITKLVCCSCEHCRQVGLAGGPQVPSV